MAAGGQLSAHPHPGRIVQAARARRGHRRHVGGLQHSGFVSGARRAGRQQNQMAPGYEEGFGFLRNVALDQHLLTRQRTNDLVAVVKKFPNLLGIGLDENTAIVVHGDNFEVLGASKVAIYDPKRTTSANETPYYFLQTGDRFNLRTRQKEASVAANLSPSNQLKLNNQ
jgi:cyanophycinase